MLNHFDSRRFTKLTGISIATSDIVQQITIKYRDDLTDTSAYVKIRLIEDMPISEWTVHLGPLPEHERG